MKTQTRAIWVDWETPESFITDVGELVPIRYLRKRYNLKECERIKNKCKRLDIKIHKPNGLYNVPSIHKDDVKLLLNNVE